MKFKTVAVIVVLLNVSQIVWT